MGISVDTAMNFIDHVAHVDCDVDDNASVDADTIVDLSIVSDNEVPSISPSSQTRWDDAIAAYKDVFSEPHQPPQHSIDHRIDLHDPFEHIYHYYQYRIPL